MGSPRATSPACSTSRSAATALARRVTAPGSGSRSHAGSSKRTTGEISVQQRARRRVLHRAPPPRTARAVHVSARPRHRRRRIRRLPRRRLLVGEDTRSRSSTRCSPPRTRHCPTISPRTAEYRWVDLADVDVACDAMSTASTRSATRRRWSGSAATSATSIDYVAAQRPRNRVAAARAPRRRASTVGSCSRAAWSCTARAATAARRARPSSVPRARPRTRPARRAFDPPLSAVRRDLVPEPVPRTRRRTRAVSTPRRSSTRSICAALFGREHDEHRSPRCATTTSTDRGCPRDTPYAGVASIFRSAIERGRAPRCSKTAGSSATSSTSPTSPARTCSRSSARSVRRTAQHRHRYPAHRPRPGERHLGRPVRALHLRRVGGSRPGDVRHVFASGRRRSRIWISRPQLRSAKALRSLPPRQCVTRSRQPEATIDPRGTALDR